MSAGGGFAAPASVCILTPGAIGSNPRVVKEADALHEANIRVTVVSTRTLDRVDKRDAALLRRIGWRSQRVDLRSPLAWRMRRLFQILARHGYEATRWPVLASHGFSPFTAALARSVLNTPADLYIAHYPAALPLAAAAARRNGGKYAYDAEDFHLGDCSDEPCYEAERRLVREIEARHLPGCAYVTAASPAIADAYSETYGIARPTVVLNAFPIEQGPGAATRRGSVEPGPSIYWFSQTIGPDRGLECAVRAIGAARTRPHLYLRGMPSIGYRERLGAVAAEAGVSDRVHFLEPAPPDDMERLAARYDLGLVSETNHTLARRTCLTNKLFSYLVAGVPPLMSMTPAQQMFATQAGLEDLLYPIDDADALAKLIDRILATPQLLEAARNTTFKLAEERYNWNVEKRELLALICKSMRPSKAKDQQSPC